MPWAHQHGEVKSPEEHHVGIENAVTAFRKCVSRCNLENALKMRVADRPCAQRPPVALASVLQHARHAAQPRRQELGRRHDHTAGGIEPVEQRELVVRYDQVVLDVAAEIAIDALALKCAKLHVALGHRCYQTDRAHRKASVSSCPTRIVCTPTLVTPIHRSATLMGFPIVYARGTGWPSSSQRRNVSSRCLGRVRLAQLLVHTQFRGGTKLN